MEKQLENKPIIDVDLSEETIVEIKSRVLLFNDDWHTFDEVIFQLMKATNCTVERARDLAFEVHVQGKSVVYTGLMMECLRVSSVLEEIALTTQIVT